MNEQIINIPGRLKSAIVGGHVTGTEDIIDDKLNITQADINDYSINSIEVVNHQINADTQGLDARVSVLEDQVTFEGDIQVENTVEGVVSGSGKVTTANAVRGAINSSASLQFFNGFITDGITITVGSTSEWDAILFSTHFGHFVAHTLDIEEHDVYYGQWTNSDAYQTVVEGSITPNNKQYSWNFQTYQYSNGSLILINNDVQVQQTNTVVAIDPNVLNVWGQISSLTVTFNAGLSGHVNEYMIQFIVSGDDFSLILPAGISWISEPKVFVDGNVYQISILNNLAVYAEWEGQQ